MNKLAEFGIHGASLLAAITGKQADALRKSMGARGLTSLEASILKDAKDRYKRAKALGYEDIEDRYHSDETFCDRTHVRMAGDWPTAPLMISRPLPICLIHLERGSRSQLSPPMPNTSTSSQSSST